MAILSERLMHDMTESFWADYLKEAVREITGVFREVAELEKTKKSR